MLTRICVFLTMLFLVVAAHAQDATKAETPELPVPEAKQTVLGLYVTAQEAYDKWNANHEVVKILDVRTPEEYAFVGHAAMARNIPFMFFVYEWDAEKKSAVMESNPDFIEQVKKHFRPSDTILITCRSGGRSKKAVDLLAKEGYKSVYNIIDGMEGDSVKETDSVFHGKRMKNGWKNSGAPWTYKLDPELMYLRPKN